MKKLLMSVLIIRFMVELVTNKKDTAIENTSELMNRKILHPAEFELR